MNELIQAILLVTGSLASVTVLLYVLAVLDPQTDADRSVVR